MRNSLVFPKMVYLEDVKNSNNDERVGRYKLDWDFFDKKMQQQYTYWRNKWQSDTEMPTDIAASLPQKYNEEIKEYKYIISDSVYHEIQYNTMKSAEEWSRYLVFDPDVRDMLRGPSVEYARCAFTLLSYGIESISAKYNMGVNLLIPITAMLYKLWVHQTGRGMALRNSGVNDIFNKAKTIVQKINNDDILVKVNEFKDAIKVLEDEYYVNYASKKKKN